MYKTLAIGDNIIDKYEKDGLMYAGGNALNFAMYSKILGSFSAYMGVFGTDKNSSYIQSVLDGYNIEREKCRIIDGENGYVNVEMINGEHNFLSGNSGGVGKNLNIQNADLEYIKDFDIINTNILSHFDIEQEIKKIYSVNKNIAFDFSIRFDDDSLKKYMPYIKYALISTRHLSKGESNDIMKKIGLEYPNVDIVIATRAEEGSSILCDKDIYSTNAFLNIDYKDSLGAGDAYFASFLYNYISQKENPTISMLRSSVFAGFACTLDGAFGECS